MKKIYASIFLRSHKRMVKLQYTQKFNSSNLKNNPAYLSWHIHIIIESLILQIKQHGTHPTLRGKEFRNKTPR